MRTMICRPICLTLFCAFSFADNAYSESFFCVGEQAVGYMQDDNREYKQTLFEPPKFVIRPVTKEDRQRDDWAFLEQHVQGWSKNDAKSVVSHHNGAMLGLSMFDVGNFEGRAPNTGFSSNLFNTGHFKMNSSSLRFTAKIDSGRSKEDPVSKKVFLFDILYVVVGACSKI